MPIEHLPLVILRCLADHCSTDDLVNVACCSKRCSSILKPILWQSVRINLNGLSELDLGVLRSLLYATRLHIFGGPVEVDGESNTEFDRGLILSQVLSYCDPMRVKKLILDDVTEFTSRYILGVLRFIKSLDIISYYRDWEEWDFDKVIEMLPSLYDLTLPDIPSYQMAKILEKSKLRSLSMQISNRYYNGEETLKHVSKDKDLRKLSVHCMNMIPPDLKPLAELQNVTELHLSGDFSEDSFLHLCRFMQNLQILKLGMSKILRDEFLREIHQLKSLTHLMLESQNSRLTAKCLEPISLMRSLRFLTFWDVICKRKEKDEFEKVALLNGISTLEEIYIRSDSRQNEGNISKCMAMIVFGLLQGKSWKLKYTPSVGYTCSQIK